MLKKIFFTYFIFSLVFNSHAQSVLDTINLPEVRLSENRLFTHDIGSKKEIIYLNFLSEGASVDLSTIINRSTSIYAKEYGALATPAFRGTTSAHTLILWNGLPINSIANGLSDFSSIYTQGFSDLIVVNGGDGSIFGSGAIGGSIHLNSNTNLIKSNSLKISSTIGSYGLSSNSISYSFVKDKLVAKLDLHALKDDNNFEYINTTIFGSPLSVNEYGMKVFNSTKLSVIYKTNSKTTLGIDFWNNNLDREVPQNMTISFSDAKQYDKSTRILFKLNRNSNNYGFKFKQAYIQEDFLYTEQIKDIYSKYLAETYISDLDFKFIYRKYLLNLGTAFTNNQVNNNNYQLSSQKEYNLAFFSALQYRANNIIINSILRKEWHSTFKVPFIPTLALENKFNNFIKARFKINRNFRSPTFNDRFWFSSGSKGNIDILPEDAFNKEIGLDFTYKKVHLSITSYHLNIYDMILWQPVNNIWTPNNIKEVLSRGVELTFNMKHKNIILNGNYSYTKSTNEVATNSLDNSIGDQLRYVPVHKAYTRMLIKQDDLELQFTKSYTGEVITSYGMLENNTLDSYIITNISVKYKFSFIPILLHAKIKNLMDKSYVSYGNYPNPGREYVLTINYLI
ncbi:MAG: hypothetical protein CMD08_00845 [Flavobacteriales bacterium]|nr:hypothetical protein [Flavobacteriales bacterium]